MEPALSSQAEQRAQAAEHLPAFGGLNLLHIKREVSKLLPLIGRVGIFEEYTTHDVTHVDAMLELLTWLVPEESQSAMTTADWLLVTLAVYFHDLGLLVTREEYDRRFESGYRMFVDELVDSPTDDGRDYWARISDLPAPDRERYLYQEFVRHNHAKRIRGWVEGRDTRDLGVAAKQLTIVRELLSPLGRVFKADLGMVCESHHLNDLNNTDKYKLSQPYGNSEEETANLQYCAILLRTADLLHITSDRTPSVMFKAISPTDPISQGEWAKQRAVRRVRPKIVTNKEGILDPSLPRNTIEVHATFANPNGFFGLNAYLAYAAKELQQSFAWADESKRKHSIPYSFPWRYIDDTHIETEGFLKERFGFTIDQQRILDLLTGHTLYNDTNVVLRELVQNALDAVRLRCLEEPVDRDKARIHIHWNSSERSLRVTDTGTGMTQQIIEDNLLRVGASRYEEREFKEEHPDFNPISRFGIGVLSAFMVADAVEVLTCHPDDNWARQLTLRNVHGRYLIQLFDKTSDEVRQRVGTHGTEVVLRVRPSANVQDIEAIARHWILVPQCAVTLTVDGSEPMTIGYATPADALRAAMGSEHGDNALITSTVEIRERSFEGMTVAYAVRWSDVFQEWEFVRSPGTQRGSVELATCVEGIRVLSGTPGYDDRFIYAMVNATGRGAPRTNVARSGFEVSELHHLLMTIYRMLFEHVMEEVNGLKDRGFSLTWASREAHIMLNTLSYGSQDADPLDDDIFYEEASRLPILVVEQEDDTRALISAEELRELESFWTIESSLLNHAEELIREVSDLPSLRSLLSSATNARFSLPDGLILRPEYASDLFSETMKSSHEISGLVARRNLRRLDIEWTRRTGDPRWIQGLPSDAQLPDWARALGRGDELFSTAWRGVDSVWVPAHSVAVEGFGDDVAAAVGSEWYLLPGTELAEFMKRALNDDVEAQFETGIALVYAFSRAVRGSVRAEVAVDELEGVIVRGGGRVDIEAVRSFALSVVGKVFHVGAWERGHEPAKPWD